MHGGTVFEQVHACLGRLCHSRIVQTVKFHTTCMNSIIYLDRSKRETYTKAEVDELIKYAIDEARRIDEESMAKHNRDATVLSMILGFTTLALFVDGLLRLLGIIPPFMEIDIDLLDKVVDKVEADVIDKIRQVPIQKILQSGFR